MQEYTLQRTDDRPVVFTGELIASAKSPGHARSLKSSTEKAHWFEMDCYKTAGGKYIISLRYRYQGKLFREVPYDKVILSDSQELMFREADDFDPMSVVGGYPKTEHWRDKQTGLERDIRRDYELLCEVVEQQLLNRMTPERIA